MSREFQLIVEVWSAVRDAVPAAKRSETALGIMNALSEYGFTSKDLMDVVEEDHDLAEAFNEVFPHDEEEDDFLNHEDE